MRPFPFSRPCVRVRSGRAPTTQRQKNWLRRPAPARRRGDGMGQRSARPSAANTPPTLNCAELDPYASLCWDPKSARRRWNGEAARALYGTLRTGPRPLSGQPPLRGGQGVGGVCWQSQSSKRSQARRSAARGQRHRTRTGWQSRRWRRARPRLSCRAEPTPSERRVG